jgi:hypothetical protein
MAVLAASFKITQAAQLAMIHSAKIVVCGLPALLHPEGIHHMAFAVAAQPIFLSATMIVSCQSDTHGRFSGFCLDGKRNDAKLLHLPSRS